MCSLKFENPQLGVLLAEITENPIQTGLHNKGNLLAHVIKKSAGRMSFKCDLIQRFLSYQRSGINFLLIWVFSPKPTPLTLFHFMLITTIQKYRAMCPNVFKTYYDRSTLVEVTKILK